MGGTVGINIGGTVGINMGGTVGIIRFVDLLIYGGLLSQYFIK